MEYNVLKSLKDYTHYVYAGGHWFDTPEIYVNGELAPENVISFISDFVHFSLESTYFREETKVFLRSSVSGVKGAIEHYNTTVSNDKKLDYTLSRNRVSYDMKKINKAFGCDCVIELMNNPDRYGEFKEVLIGLMVECNMTTPQAKALGFNIKVNGAITELDKDSFQALLKVLSRYSKVRMEQLGLGETKELPLEYIQYFNYLTTASELNAMEQARLEKINEVLKI